ncbi:MAG TPA: glycine/sarcosine/betaine reductase complex component C subunit beta [Symbiobacteriaceae bacterium]|jgi:betaine reductase|nr:glycine/sarcosine/betaine reductase complex component C subunit beta [Symbiobacteriaceae bacterium]
MTFPVIKGAAYCLVHAPDLLLHYGTTPTTEREVNPGSKYLKQLPGYLRSYEYALNYAPNQAYIGRFNPLELHRLPRPWYEHSLEKQERFGPYGEIMPEPEFIALMKVVDTFDLVWLEEHFADEMALRFADHPLFYGTKLGAGKSRAELKAQLDEGRALPLYHAGDIVAVVRRAHDVDEALSAHIVLENLVTKASAVLAFKHLLSHEGVQADQVEYIIECSEEACGDMNQRGGGNFAKAIGEAVGCVNATGSDTRAFCAAPTHALIEAAALVQAGVYKHVVVVAGGTPAKLGLNSRDHIGKGISALEDVIGAFAVHVGEDDFVSPRIRLDACGRHKIGSGSSPQAAMEALVVEPLDRAGWKLTDMDRYGVEMQNPECTEPAGAGDVPKSNYKLIGALAVKRGEIERTALEAFATEHGFPGFAPTQGHVPSGVPVIGPVREMIMQGLATRAMIIGKGSLFLGRMTNLFDGVSFVMEKNPGRPAEKKAVERTRTRVGVTVHGSELGEAEVVRGAEMAQRMHPDLEVVLIGDPGVKTRLEVIPADCLGTEHRLLEQRLASGDLAAAVTLHYPFPIGVATVGKVATPGRGREIYLATTTGTVAADRVEAMAKSAIYGIACAKAAGLAEPVLGVLNVEGAPQVEKLLTALGENGYRSIRWAVSGRADGGALMRGNDVLGGTPDVLVTDSLTGNVLMKMLSAYSTGGIYESVGCGYGPGVGEQARQIIHIISRASGAPVIAGAIAYAGEMAAGGLVAKVAEELSAARAAGLDQLLAQRAAGGLGVGTAATPATAGAPVAPPEKVATAEIAGVEILRLEEAVQCLWAKGIYARPGMGCTGPVVLVADEDLAGARQALTETQFL